MWHVDDIVAALGLRLGSDRQQEFIPLAGDIVDRDVDLFLLGPLVDQGLGGVVGAGHPMIPQADGQLAGSAGRAHERGCQTRCGGAGGGCNEFAA